jgi:hypothetical protein
MKAIAYESYSPPMPHGQHRATYPLLTRFLQGNFVEDISFEHCPRDQLSWLRFGIMFSVLQVDSRVVIYPKIDTIHFFPHCSLHTFTVTFKIISYTVYKMTLNKTKKKMVILKGLPTQRNKM